MWRNKWNRFLLDLLVAGRNESERYFTPSSNSCELWHNIPVACWPCWISRRTWVHAAPSSSSVDGSAAFKPTCFWLSDTAWLCCWYSNNNHIISGVFHSGLSTLDVCVFGYLGKEAVSSAAAHKHVVAAGHDHCKHTRAKSAAASLRLCQTRTNIIFCTGTQTLDQDGATCHWTSSPLCETWCWSWGTFWSESVFPCVVLRSGWSSHEHTMKWC